MVLTPEKLLEQLKIAFQGVNREGGVSWSEAQVIDNYGSNEERNIARSSDKDRTWIDLATDPAWDVWDCSSNWSFLDKIGFRYYVAAAIARDLILGGSALNQFSLSPPDSVEQWDFTKDQIRVFVAYMEHKVNEQALCELDSDFRDSGIDVEEYLVANGPYDLEPFKSWWQEPLEYWTSVLATDTITGA